MNDIKNLLQHNKITDFVKLSKLTPKDIAEFANRNTKWAGKLFQNLDPKHAAKAFKLLQNEQQEEVIKALPEEKAAELLNALQPDDRTAFLEELSGSHVKELLKVLTPERRTETLELLGYNEGSVGEVDDARLFGDQERADLSGCAGCNPAAGTGHGDAELAFCGG